MNIIGNQRALRILNRQLMRRDFVHTYLFIGPEGVGKFDLALQFAMEINGVNTALIDQDIKVIEAEIIEEKGRIRKKEISISKIREGLHFLNLSAEKNRYRILIIRNGEDMNIQSQNAILKSIEDPSGKSIVIIVTKNDELLLPTVISRSQRIVFNLVKKTEMIEAFGGEKPAIEKIADLSLGRPGWMKKMIDDPSEIEKRNRIKAELSIVLTGNNNQKMKIIEGICRDKESVKENIELWMAFARGINGNPEGRKYDNADHLRYQLIEKLIFGLGNISRTNANPRLVLESLVII
jgi:DNA polymerase III subunit delta'